MNGLAAVAPVIASPQIDASTLVRTLPPLQAPVSQLPLSQIPVSHLPATTSFYQMLVNGAESVNADVLNADKLVRAFALDDSIPVHQVTYALEQTRLSLELAVQVRTRLIEGYQQLMNMQL